MIAAPMQLPRDKGDTATAKMLAQRSLDELAPHLAELLTWIQDYNWPVAKIVGPVLTACDDRIVPHIRAVLSGHDDVWKYWTLSQVVAHLPKTVRDELMDEVVRIINSPTPGEKQEDVDLVARDVMVLYSSEGPG